MPSSATAPRSACDPATTDAVRHRDADTTRQLLLEAARLRFARDGYSSTTVRHIAGDVGVNVALINRYFTSKEGLFESCLRGAVESLDRSNAPEVTVDDMLTTMIRHIVGSSTGERPLHLLLLLRSSGDADADLIRRNTLRSVAERIATVAGWNPAEPATDALILRAQVALSTALGIVLLRSSSGLEPLSSGDTDDLGRVLGDVFSALLGAPKA